MNMISHGPEKRDENGQYIIENEGKGEVQSIEAQTPQDLKQQAENIPVRGRTECVCKFSSSEAISVLRGFNDAYKNRKVLIKGMVHADESKIVGYRGEVLVGSRGPSRDSMAFVVHCSDGVKIPLKMQVNYMKIRDAAGNETEEAYRCFQLPPSYDKVDEGVKAIRERLNDTMYEGGTTSGKGGSHGERKEKVSFWKAIPVLKHFI